MGRFIGWRWKSGEGLPAALLLRRMRVFVGTKRGGVVVENEILTKLNEILNILQAKFTGRAPRCNHCGSPNTVVTRTAGRTRYCKCRDCKENFKSIGPTE